MSTAKESGAKHPRHRALLDGTPYRGRSVMDAKSKVKKTETKPTSKEEKVEKKSEAKKDKK